MRRFLMLSMMGVALAAQSEETDTLKSVELQNVQVVSTRATRKTPMAFTRAGGIDPSHPKDTYGIY